MWSLDEPGGAMSMRKTHRTEPTTAAAPKADAGADAIEVTFTSAIRELEEARKIAIAKKQAAAAISATLAKVKLAGLLAEKPETGPEPSVFDGNYTEAARRIAFLLRLAEHEESGGRI